MLTKSARLSPVVLLKKVDLPENPRAVVVCVAVLVIGTRAVTALVLVIVNVIRAISPIPNGMYKIPIETRNIIEKARSPAVANQIRVIFLL